MRTTNLNQSGLERIVVGDDVLEKSLLGEKRFNSVKPLNYDFHWDSNDVQLIVERGIVDLCKKRGPHPQAFILEVLDYIQNMHYPLSSISRIGDPEVESFVPEELKTSFEFYVADFSQALKNLIGNNFFQRIQKDLKSKNLARCYLHDIYRLYGKDNATYSKIWTPWFSNLHSDFQKNVSHPEDMKSHFASLLKSFPKPVFVEDDMLLHEFTLAQDEVLPFQNEVHMRLEKKIVEICEADGLQPKGIIIDALNSIIYRYFPSFYLKDMVSKPAKPEIKKYMLKYKRNVASSIKDSLQELMQDSSLEEDDLKHILYKISRLYETSLGENIHWGKREPLGLGESLHLYNQLWIPSFKKMREKFKEEFIDRRGDPRRSRFKELVILNNEQVDIEDDMLLDEVVLGEYRERDFSQYKNKPNLVDHVQLHIEKEIFDYCCKNGIQSYGFVVDALAAAACKGIGIIRHNRPSNYESQIHSIDNLTCIIKNSLLDAVSKYELKDVQVKEIVEYIKSRYEGHGYCSIQKVPLTIKVNNPRTNPYEVPWEPWFKNLDSSYKKLKAVVD